MKKIPSKPAVPVVKEKKTKKQRSIPDDAVVCQLCVKQIETDGKTETGATEPYRAASLITHFKQAHGTNALGIDQKLGLPPGTTIKCSPSLMDKFVQSGSMGANALQARIEELEAKAIKAGK